ncbi:MAG: molybdopterin-synthase adenylyltransferase MoeB [Lentisphaeria bacterium]|nr:molybdopterin-synthase adenylyltransferase MoeB [Lentisphaeria bacterium]
MQENPFTLDELKHYQRHFTLRGFGQESQLKLKESRILCVGTGGLGAPVLMYLAAAGVGHITVIDDDIVDESNLQRQIIHDYSTLGTPKVESAKTKMLAINPNVKVEVIQARLGVDNALELIGSHDLVVDGTDNFATRYLVNDACVMTGTPNCYGSIFEFTGHASVFGTPDGPCYRCLFPEPPDAGSIPNCAEAGVLGILPGTIGLIQATEAVKMLTGIGTPLIGRFMTYDALQMQFKEIKLNKNPDCPVCGTNPSITELKEEFLSCQLQEEEEDMSEIEQWSVEEVQAYLEANPDYICVDVREPFEFQMGFIPNSILIPVGEIADRSNEVPKQEKTIIYCKAGMRSQMACEALQEQGFENLINVTGGMMAWANGEREIALPY